MLFLRLISLENNICVIYRPNGCPVSAVLHLKCDLLFTIFFSLSQVLCSGFIGLKTKSRQYLCSIVRPAWPCIYLFLIQSAAAYNQQLWNHRCSLCQPNKEHTNGESMNNILLTRNKWAFETWWVVKSFLFSSSIKTDQFRQCVSCWTGEAWLWLGITCLTGFEK